MLALGLITRAALLWTVICDTYQPMMAFSSEPERKPPGATVGKNIDQSEFGYVHVQYLQLYKVPKEKMK